MPIEPDTKDWTWVVHTPCPDCGFDAQEVPETRLAEITRQNAPLWEAALGRSDAAVRPADNVWSTLEYACHIRDVHELFAARVRQMLAEDDPQFANWDQDETAIEGRYGEQEPSQVAEELLAAAEDVAVIYDSVSGDQWQRPGRRSNGSVFTVATLGQYHLHDVVHHTYDIHQ